jgi:FtsZ-binding cell division protein ZapB
MNDQSSELVARARERLTTALDSLEAAVQRRIESQRDTAALDAEIQQLSEDRSRLAQDLDRAKARSTRLESATSHVAERLDAAIASIGSLLERNQAS